MNATDWSIQWWRQRHDKSYFPGMEQHKDWRIYPTFFEPVWEAVSPEKNDTALEIGCGYGQWMIPLSACVHSVYGVDLHHYLMDKATEKFKLHKAHNCRMIVNDGKSLPFADCSFSLIYSISVFQHIPRATVAEYLREAYRVMMPSGRGAFHFRRADGIGPYSKDIGVNHRGDFSTGWTEEEAHEAGTTAGFTSVKVVSMGQSLLLVTGKE
jgi:ubiquinone/menaquinone biosynthesis C-methylase UbiE